MALISYEDLSAVLQSVKTKVDAVHEDLDTRISENEEVTSAALVDLNERLETVEQQGGGDISAELNFVEGQYLFLGDAYIEDGNLYMPTAVIDEENETITIQ